MTRRFSPLMPRIGAIAAIPRAELVAPDFTEECLEALERYGVLVFPDVGFTDEEQIAFGKNIGAVIPQGPVLPDGTRGSILKVSLDPRENPMAAEYLKGSLAWHIDEPIDDGINVGPTPTATLLSARRVPPEGAQTEWCSSFAAWEDLSEADQELCESLRVVHSMEAVNRHVNPDASREERERWREHSCPKEHPLVWRHRSGRRSLVLGVTADYVVGRSRSESDALLERLTAHATREAYVYRHHWKASDFLIWSNYGTLHRAIPYDPGSGRLLHRTIVYRPD